DRDVGTEDLADGVVEFGDRGGVELSAEDEPEPFAGVHHPQPAICVRPSRLQVHECLPTTAQMIDAAALVISHCRFPLLPMPAEPACLPGVDSRDVLHSADLVKSLRTRCQPRNLMWRSTMSP